MADEQAQEQSPSGFANFFKPVTNFFASVFNGIAEDNRKKAAGNALYEIRSELLIEDQKGNKDKKLQKGEVENAASRVRGIAERFINAHPELENSFKDELSKSQQYFDKNTNKVEITHTATGLVFDREGFAAFLNSFNKDSDQLKNSHKTSSSDIKLQVTPVSTPTDLGNGR